MEKMETQAKNSFAIASAKVREEEEKLSVLLSRKDGYENKLKELYEDILDIAKISETNNAIENIKYQIGLQKQALKQAEAELEIARIKLQEAMQDRKTHEKLKEKEFEQFMADEAAKESKEIDELVSYRFGQKEEE